MISNGGVKKEKRYATQSTHRKTTESFGMNHTLMNKHIRRSIVGNNKAKTFLWVEPFDRSVLHGRHETKAGCVLQAKRLSEAGLENAKHDYWYFFLLSCHKRKVKTTRKGLSSDDDTMELLLLLVKAERICQLVGSPSRFARERGGEKLLFFDGPASFGSSINQILNLNQFVTHNSVLNVLSQNYPPRRNRGKVKCAACNHRGRLYIVPIDGIQGLCT